MTYNTYPYKLPSLEFAYNALEPYIDAETIYYHHDKHFRAYVDNLNKALQPYPDLQKLTLVQLLSGQYRLPQQDKTAILHNGGGVYNHTLYFNGLAPAATINLPQGELLTLINAHFSSWENFKQLLNNQAAAVFGSGYTFLTINNLKQLSIISTPNQDTVLPQNLRALITIDVWEHAYYLGYKNLRANYLHNIWQVLRFPSLDM